MTSFSWLYVLLFVLLTDFSDCSKFVVSPSISTMMPLIRDAIGLPFLGIRKEPVLTDSSRAF